MDGGSRKRGILLIFTFVTIIHLFAPLILAGVTSWDVSTDWRFYSGSTSDSGPIFFSDAFTCTSITQSGSLVRFAGFNMDYSWGSIGFSCDTSTANMTIQTVNSTTIEYRANAPSGVSSSQIYTGGKGGPSSVTGVLNWTYANATDIILTYQNHTSPVDVVITFDADADTTTVFSLGIPFVLVLFLLGYAATRRK